MQLLLRIGSSANLVARSGGQAIDAKTGEMVQIRDHGLDSANVQAMYKSRNMQMPVVLIAGSSMQLTRLGTSY